MDFSKNMRSSVHQLQLDQTGLQDALLRGVSDDDFREMIALKSKHFPSRFWFIIALFAVCVGLISAGCVLAITFGPLFYLLIAVSILIILIYGKIDEKATIKAYPGFRVDLEMLNSAFRGSGKSFQMYSQTGSTFQIESLADSPNAFPLQFVMEGENSVFSTQPSVFVESVAGRDYATHAFVREVAMLNEIRRQRKMTSTWWIWLQMFVFIGAVAVGAALAIFFSQSNAIAIVFSVLGGFVSGYGLCMLIGHFVRVEVERFLDSTASVMEELQHRHMDENAWEWYFEDTRTSPKFKLFRMIEKFSPISLHVTAEFAFMGIRKKLSDDASSSHLDIV